MPTMSPPTAAGCPAADRSVPPPVSLRLLGSFEVTRVGRALPLPMSAQRLVALLGLHGRPLMRSFVAGTLWLDMPEERAAASLRSTLWRLHGAASGLVTSANGQLALSSGTTVDLEQARARARRILDEPNALDAGDEPARVLELDVLPQWYDDWVMIERERFRQMRLRALEALSGQLLQRGRCHRALEAGLAAVAAEPLRESAHRAVIAVHLAEGNRSEAVRQYELYRQLLQDELRVAPSPLMESLMSVGDGTKAAGPAERSNTDPLTAA